MTGWHGRGQTGITSHQFFAPKPKHELYILFAPYRLLRISNFLEFQVT